ncbi:hypothetical protein, partial [Anaeromyxobacter sp. SG26]|uniref:hypothetical protein n=1 Tax=Anaeromyxobacter sp. SG26 TaxID=2925407 RepID=UPI0035A8FC2C
ARDLRAVGGGCGARVSGGALEGADLALDGDVGLVVERGEATLVGGHLHGALSGATVHGGTATLRHLAVDGPSREAGLAVAGGAAHLEGVVIRSPGPAGIAIAGGRVEGAAVVVAGVSEEQGIPGACVQVRRGSLALSASTLLRCGGAAVEASGGEVRLSSVDASGGAAGGIVLLDGATAVLDGNLVTGHGPALALGGGLAGDRADEPLVGGPGVLGGLRERRPPGARGGGARADPVRRVSLTRGVRLDKKTRP